MTVTIIENGTSIGTATITTSHTYALQIPLAIGNNSVVAQETNGCGMAKTSATIAIQRQAASILNHGTLNSVQQNLKQSVSLSFIQAALSRPLNQPLAPMPNTPGYAQPIITQPSTGSTFGSQKIWVKSVAQSESVSTVYLNDHSVARINVPTGDEYGALVELKPGKNTIQVRSRKDTMAAISEIVYVNFTRPEATGSPTISTIRIIMISIVLVIFMGSLIWLLYGFHIVFGRMR